MACSLVEPLNALLDQLADQGYEAHVNEIDARIARSPFCTCTKLRRPRRLHMHGDEEPELVRALDLPGVRPLVRGLVMADLNPSMGGNSKVHPPSLS